MNHLRMRFPGGLGKAFTMSYDDGVKFDMRLSRIFDDHGIRGTFHLNSNYDMSGADALSLIHI